MALLSLACRRAALICWKFLPGSLPVIRAFQTDKPQMRKLRSVSFHGRLLRVSPSLGKDRPKCLQMPHSYSRLLSESVVACLLVGLLVTQRDHGIDTHRPPRRHIACRHGHQNQNHGHCHKRQRIRRTDSV
jgi:hypothetical protein